MRTGVRMDVDIHKRLTAYITARRYTPEKTSIDATITRAVEHWLDAEEKRETEPKPDNASKNESTPTGQAVPSANKSNELQLALPDSPTYTPSTPEEIRWVKLLLEVLRSRSVDAIGAVQSNLAVFARIAATDSQFGYEGDQDASGASGRTRGPGKAQGPHSGVAPDLPAETGKRRKKGMSGR